MARANNIRSSRPVAPLSTGAYQELLPLNTGRATFLLYIPSAGAAVNLVFGGDVPADDTAAFTMDAGSSMDLSENAPMGPVWMRAVAAATVDMFMLEG